MKCLINMFLFLCFFFFFYFLRCNQCCQPQSDWWLAGQKVVEWPEALHVLWDLLHLWPECGESLPGRWEGCRKSGDELNDGDGLEYRVLFWLDIYRSGTIFVIDSLIWIWGLHHWEIGVGILDFVILVRVGCVFSPRLCGFPLGTRDR